MPNDWRIRIIEQPGQFDLALWIFRRGQNGGTEMWYSDRIETFAAGTEIKNPSLTLSPDMLKALQMALSDRGIRPDHESVAEGKLEATEAHLADLRHLLKLPIEYSVIGASKHG